ncbi:MAG: hypothetical protein J6B01_10035 [Ruminococcus sp.]|nr:hypothetical protein [Ruminococcus sp.]MBP3380797.1 hypothetical protein [Ruminococcus sp.]
MSINKELLENFFNDKFTKKFFKNRDYQTRLNVSIISSVCTEMMNTPEKEWTNEFRDRSVNMILNQCCQIMKLSDVYVNLSRVYDNMEYTIKVVDLEQLLLEFSEECNQCLGGNLTQHIPGKIVCIEVCEEILLCLMLLYIRRVVMEGAKKIILSHSSDGKTAEIFFEITEKGEPVRSTSAENVSMEYAYDLIDIFAEKLDCNADVSETGLKLRFKLKNDGNIRFQCPEPVYGKKLFSLYHDLLSDLGDITLI